MSPRLYDNKVFLSDHSGNGTLLGANKQINFLGVNVIPNHGGNMLIIQVNGRHFLKVVIKVLIKNNSISHGHSYPILIKWINLHTINRCL